MNNLFHHKSALVALSGGVDSALLLVLAKEAGLEVHAATVLSEFTPAAEIMTAKNFAESCGILWHPIKISILEYSEIQNNPPERCYLCKKIIMQEMKKIAASLGLEAVYDGTHADDIAAGNRPGVQALKELGIISPFADAGVSKAKILEEAVRRNISSPPPSACLATRIPHGTQLTAEALAIVDAAETTLRNGGVTGILRVRLTEGGGAVVETENPMQETAKIYEDKLKQLGLTTVSYRDYRGA